MKQLQLWLCTFFVLLIMGWGIFTPAAAINIYSVQKVSSGESTWVIDDAEVLSRLTEGQISTVLGSLAEQTGQEVRFVTVRHLDYGQTIQSFTDALFNRWFPTPEEQAHQVLVVLDSVSNDAAIHTGEAVKAVLSDETSASVVNETLPVPLRAGDRYNQAFMDASDRLVAVLSGQPDPGPPAVQAAPQVEGTFASAAETQENRGVSSIIVIVLLIAATVIPMVTYFIYVGGSSD
jgi:uncharacterized protein